MEFCLFTKHVVDLPKVIQGEQVIQRRAASAGENSPETSRWFAHRCEIIWRCLKRDSFEIVLGNAMKWVAQTWVETISCCNAYSCPRFSPVLFATLWFGRFISYIDSWFYVFFFFSQDRREFTTYWYIVNDYRLLSSCWIYSSTRASTIVHYNRCLHRFNPQESRGTAPFFAASFGSCNLKPLSYFVPSLWQNRGGKGCGLLWKTLEHHRIFVVILTLNFQEFWYVHVFLTPIPIHLGRFQNQDE